MSLLWTTRKPTAPGWYWHRLPGDRRAKCLEVELRASGLYLPQMVAPMSAMMPAEWAGPIAQPKEPSKESLATVRYELGGANLTGQGGWGSNGWEKVELAEMKRRIGVHLWGGLDWEGKPWPADSSKVWLYTSVKRNGRWVRQPGQVFTRENFPNPNLQGATDATEVHTLGSAGAIPAPAPIAAGRNPAVVEAGQQGSAFAGAPLTGSRREVSS